MSNTKQTAVEYLEEFLNTHCNPSVCDIDYSDFKTAINEAKQMEKEQIENAYDVGFYEGIEDANGDGALYDTSHEYYTQTYEN